MAVKDPPPPVWLPVSYEIADVVAVQAMAEGRATADQQKRALHWIVELAANTYDLSFRPGTEGDRDTAFHEGRRFVGNQIRKLLLLKVGMLKDQPDRRKIA